MAAHLASHELCQVGMESTLVGAALDSGIGIGNRDVDLGPLTLDFRGKGIYKDSRPIFQDLICCRAHALDLILEHGTAIYTQRR